MTKSRIYLKRLGILIPVILMLLVSHTVSAKKKKVKIPLPGVTSIAVLPFTYVMQDKFSDDADTLAADAFAEVLAKKGKLSVVEVSKAQSVMEEMGLDLSKPPTADTIKSLCGKLGADAVLIGDMPLYDEKEDQSMVPTGGYNRATGDADGYVENMREIRVTFSLSIYRADTGEQAGEMTIETKQRDTAKDPMMPASPEILLERCAKSTAKKLVKSIKK